MYFGINSQFLNGVENVIIFLKDKMPDDLQKAQVT